MPERKSIEAGIKYSVKQLELFSELVAHARCSYPDIHELTGIPLGTINHLRKQTGVEFETMQHDKIRQARHMRAVRQRYGERIGRLFPRQED